MSSIDNFDFKFLTNSKEKDFIEGVQDLFIPCRQKCKSCESKQKFNTDDDTIDKLCTNGPDCEESRENLLKMNSALLTVLAGATAVISENRAKIVSVVDELDQLKQQKHSKNSDQPQASKSP